MRVRSCLLSWVMATGHLPMLKLLAIATQWAAATLAAGWSRRSRTWLKQAAIYQVSRIWELLPQRWWPTIWPFGAHTFPEVLHHQTSVCSHGSTNVHAIFGFTFSTQALKVQKLSTRWESVHSRHRWHSAGLGVYADAACWNFFEVLINGASCAP